MSLKATRSPSGRNVSRRMQPLPMVVLAVFALGVAACSSGTDAAGGAGEAAGDPAHTAIIDVRTPGEFASGHVEGAVNIDVLEPTFDAQVAALDSDEVYLVYCRSGNRSADAVDRMAALGLTVLDGGGLGDMAAQGYPAGT